MAELRQTAGGAYAGLVYRDSHPCMRSRASLVLGLAAALTHSRKFMSPKPCQVHTLLGLDGEGKHSSPLHRLVAAPRLDSSANTAQATSPEVTTSRSMLPPGLEPCVFHAM